MQSKSSKIVIHRDVDKMSYPQASVDTVDKICSTFSLQHGFKREIGTGVIPNPVRGVSDAKLTGLGDKLWTVFGLFTGCG